MIDPTAGPDPPLEFPDPPRDRFEFWVRFLFGALFGVLVGLLLWVRFLLLRFEHGWLAIPIIGLLFAFSAARFGDNFWTSFRWRDGGD
jgi:hypothetical protein